MTLGFYNDFVSDEPLEIIRLNEAEYRIPNLTTSRIRRLFNELYQAYTEANVIRASYDEVSSREDALTHELLVVKKVIKRFLKHGRPSRPTMACNQKDWKRDLAALYAIASQPEPKPSQLP